MEEYNAIAQQRESINTDLSMIFFGKFLQIKDDSNNLILIFYLFFV
jgi:hypothetical protein